ncbi:DNA polymerase-3 subunit alpha [Enterococcus sp. PF1-24]|uniref:DNA polymerase III subunit alpha n=1 Tax=unclassified Enterococcus TaxID=2608891 RepID=UPI002474D554|nr:MULTISPECIES: DNA polymerase III subunit alpha [unclassified Enterococcus]MDH6365256.1 DNA polymerase-3 subunit alpha [Enterococcus sp. PFB1-1]MDH6402357.1 DNA polymerase-3 subunit alpha [Enterococcus sp. PF1-24]
MAFPQLYTTTNYTLLQSTLRIPQFVETAKTRGYQSLGITDRNVLSGVLEFYQACKKNQIQPVIGLQLDYQVEDFAEPLTILLYAKDEIGYRNLIQLSSYNMTHKEPLFLLEQANQLNHLYGVLPEENQLQHRFATTDAAEVLAEYRTLAALFEENSFFIGLSLSHFEKSAAPWLHFLQENQLPLLALQNVSYLEAEEDFSLRVLRHIQDGTVFEEDLNSLGELRGENYLRNEAIIADLFKQQQVTALKNAEALVANCQFELPLNQQLLPHYPVPTEESSGAYLQRLCQSCLPQRVENLTEEYQQRLNYELEIIHKMGFDDYFLIVWDVLDYAHQNQIVTGAGRGSAAGSLVAYVLSITDVDPLQYGLLFERFLNPERYTMPDIDIDIPDNKREVILKYVQEKYGKYHMAQIATFGTMAAKMVLRDVARVFGLSQSEANLWSKAIPNRLKITLAEAVTESNQLKQLTEQSEKYRLLFQTALQLEGLPRHVSTHAAGVVISDQDLLNFIPLQAGSDDILLTQFTMNDVEAVGLLKMDFLGLRNLSIIDNTLQGIKKVYQQSFDFKKIPLDDPATLQLFQRGETSGVFQFESAGIRNVLRRLEPNNIEDIAAVNALYRPGPMQNIDTFIRRKKGLEAIRYPDDSLQGILANTYGVIVYQEQVMQVASQMAGFSYGQADILRRAMSKKKKSVLDEQRKLFVAGALTNGHSEKRANEVYDYIDRFANYGFNRSHAFAYSFVGFQMAYLKVHFPAPFYTAVLHSVRHNPTKIKEYVSEARKNKITILPPAINRSSYSFKIVGKDQLLFGFSSLKGIRRDFIKEIIDERQAEGPYRSFDQFLIRIHNRWLKRENIEPLIAIGVFDELTPNRRQLMLDLDGKIQNVLYSGGSMDLLDIMTLKSEEMADYALEERLALEEQYLGVYLSGHPSESYPKLRRTKQVATVADLLKGEKTKLLLYIKDIREIRTKKGEQMAFLKGSDSSGEISVTIFPKLYRQVRGSIQLNSVCYVEGKIEESNYNQELQLLAEQVADASLLESQLTDQICYLKVVTEQEQPEVLQNILQIMKDSPGPIPIIVLFEKDRRKVQLAEEYWVTDSQQLQQQLKQILGDENVVFEKK